jgi:hypothetical protein
MVVEQALDDMQQPAFAHAQPPGVGEQRVEVSLRRL